VSAGKIDFGYTFNEVHQRAESQLSRRLNGLLLNWYDGTLGHYIGSHRDSPKNLIIVCPIVTISFGEERIFRLRRWRSPGSPKIDLPITHGSVVVVPHETNQTFTHQVPAFRKWRGKRVSVTIRGFEVAARQ